MTGRCWCGRRVRRMGRSGWRRLMRRSDGGFGGVWEGVRRVRQAKGSGSSLEAPNPAWWRVFLFTAVYRAPRAKGCGEVVYNLAGLGAGGRVGVARAYLAHWSLSSLPAEDG